MADLREQTDMTDTTRARGAGRITVTCPCGVVFETRASKAARGHGKFCSRACFFESRTGPRSEYVSMTCPCGVQFDTRASKVAAGKGKFCSVECKRRYYTRPSGLKYDIKAVNKGWFSESPKPSARRRKRSTPISKNGGDGTPTRRGRSLGGLFTIARLSSFIALGSGRITG